MKNTMRFHRFIKFVALIVSTMLCSSSCNNPYKPEIPEQIECRLIGDEVDSIETPVNIVEDSELRLGDSADHRRVGFKREYIIELYNRYRHEFNYVISYIHCLDIQFTYVAIPNHSKQVSFSHSGDMEIMTYYVDLGYEKDEEFERSLKAILVDGELGYLYYETDTCFFGSNFPIIYSLVDLYENEHLNTSDPESFCRIEENWYFLSDDHNKW